MTKEREEHLMAQKKEKKETLKTIVSFLFTLTITETSGEHFPHINQLGQIFLSGR